MRATVRDTSDWPVGARSVSVTVRATSDWPVGASSVRVTVRATLRAAVRATAESQHYYAGINNELAKNLRTDIFE